MFPKKESSRRRLRTDTPSLPGAKFVRNNTTTQSNKNTRKLISCDGKVVMPIREEDQELFLEETADDHQQKLKSKRRGRIAGDDLEEDIYEAAPPSATTPPILRSVDLLPTPYTTNHETNIILDDHSMLSNEMGISLGGTIRTTASMVTAQVRNIHRQQQRLRTNLIPTEETQVEDQCRGNVRLLTNVNQLMIDNRGRAISEEEITALWKASGMCVKCGLHRTHHKDKYGPFRIFRRMMPLTVEGICYKGYCLHCHDVPMLRSLLQEPSIPLDLPRNDLLEVSLHSMQSPEDGISEIPDRKQSPFVALFSSTLFQICCLVSFLVIAGGIVFLGIKVAKSPDVWISQPPTSAPSISRITSTPKESPTSTSWNFHSELVSNEESFGQKVKLSGDGTIIVVSSPYFEGGKGRFDVYKIGNGSKTWSRLIPVSGARNIGVNMDDLMGQGMSLSADGSTFAIGSPGNGKGLVEIFYVDVKTMTITSKGKPVVGPSPMSEFGYSVALNMNGTRLFVGAPKYVQDDIEVRGLVQAFDYDDATDSWIQIGSDMVGKSIDSRFGNAVASSYDGSKIIVGAPFDSTKFEHSGTFYCFTLDEKFRVWYHYPYNQFYGDTIDAQLGYNVAVDKSGEVFVTSLKHSTDDEHYQGAGVVMVYFIDTQLDIIETFGYPISGAYEDAQFGSQMDINAAGDIIVASGKHGEEISGAVRVYQTVNSDMVAYGAEIPGLALGSSCKPWGTGPSLSLAITSNVKRLAIGYECISIDGKQTTASAVHIYEIS